MSLNRSQLPAVLSGVVNAPYRYWLALAFCVFCVLVVAWLTAARTGHAWAAVRENEARVEVLGLSAYRAKLMAVVVGGFLGTLGGFVQLIVIGGANPHLLSTEFTLSLLIMVVLGGAGSRWGAMIGGVLYVLLDNRLQELSTSADDRRAAGGAAGAAEPAGLRARAAVRAGGVLRTGRDRRHRRAGARLVAGGAGSRGVTAPDADQRRATAGPAGSAAPGPGSDQSGPSSLLTRDSRCPTVFGCRCSTAAVRPRCPP